MQERVLNVFDIDDTLFRSGAFVGVLKDGERVRELSPAEFNNYTLGLNESFDYSQFRSGTHFRKTSKPILTVLEHAKYVVKTQGPADKTILLTARSDMTEHTEFLDTFSEHGFPINEVHVERAGNLQTVSPKTLKSPVIKAAVLRKYIKEGAFTKIRMWDDHAGNLNILPKLLTYHPSLKVEGFLVNEEGNYAKHVNTINESLDIPGESLNISRGLMPQIVAHKRDAFLKHLTDQGISYKVAKIEPHKLKASQSEFNFDKVHDLMHTPSSAGVKPPIVSNDNYIVDGHHRWLADYNLNKFHPTAALQVDLPILELLRVTRSFQGSEFRSVTETENIVRSMKSVIKESITNQRYK